MQGAGHDRIVNDHILFKEWILCRYEISNSVSLHLKFSPYQLYTFQAFWLVKPMKYGSDLYYCKSSAVWLNIFETTSGIDQLIHD